MWEVDNIQYIPEKLRGQAVHLIRADKSMLDTYAAAARKLASLHRLSVSVNAPRTRIDL
jgi:hypothetical protein